MIIYFMRHGETDYNRQALIQGRIDNPLNETGVRQAAEAARYFKENNIHFDKVYSSPLIRAHRTAAIVSGRDMADVETDARIQELSFGPAEGVTMKELSEEMLKLFRRPELYVAPEGAESLETLKTRCQDFLDDLVKLSNEDTAVHTILVTTHGAALRGLINCVEKKPLKDLWKKGLSNCSYAKVILKNSDYRLEFIGSPLRENAVVSLKAEEAQTVD